MSQIGQRGHMRYIGAIQSTYITHISDLAIHSFDIYVYWAGLEPDSQWEWLIYAYYDFLFQFANMFPEHIEYI